MYERDAVEILRLVREHDKWRNNSLNLIASETPLSDLILEEMGGHDLHKRYAERNRKGNYYYCGNKIFSKIESRVNSALKMLFSCDNVEFRPISGTNANEIVFSTYLKSDDLVMVNSTSAGGHISHYHWGSIGKFTRNLVDIPLTDDGYHMDVDKTKDMIKDKEPRLIVLGKSLFLFPEPVNDLRNVCNETGTILVYDAAHVLGLIAGGVFQDPLREGAHVLTGSTHKTFPGPQRGVILSNLCEAEWEKIEKKTFPGSVSNHHLGTVPYLGIVAFEMLDFGRFYARQTLRNAKTLAEELDNHGFEVQAKEFGYTASHQIAVNVDKFGGGKRVAETLETNNIILNMNLLPRENLSRNMNPSGIRIATHEMTRMGMMEDEMRHIAKLIKECVVDNRDVRREVIEVRKKFNKTEYCYDRKTLESIIEGI